MKIVRALVGGLAGALLLAASCGSGGQAGSAAVLDVEGFGEIRFEFLREKAPKTVDNFIKLAREGFYDGTTFHRVIPGFMVQGGDPLSKNDNPRDDGMGGPGYTIGDEFSDEPHVRGIISMANKGYPDSAGSQFFIVVKDSSWLDGKYSAFGRVTSGLEVTDRIVAVERDPRDRPLENVVVKSVRIE
jgi:peptidyl-prolyl cis-trans isomerase B (cyclophilin B)